MQTSLERRVSGLEQLTPPGQHMTLFVGFDEPGQPDAEVRVLTAGAARWERRPDEDEDEFKVRAGREVLRSALGVAILLSA